MRSNTVGFTVVYTRVVVDVGFESVSSVREHKALVVAMVGLNKGRFLPPISACVHDYVALCSVSGLFYFLMSLL